MLDGFDIAGPADALALVGAAGVLVGVGLPWLEVTTSPVDPAVAGYETIYGVLAGAVALLVLAAAVTDRVERRRIVVLLGGAVVVLLAAVPLVTVGGQQSAAIGLYVTLLAGVLTLPAGVIGR